MRKNRYEVLLYNAISLLLENYEEDKEQLAYELGMTDEEYASVMGNDC